MKLLVTGPFDGQVESGLVGRGFEIDHHGPNISQAELKEAIADADGYVFGGNEKLTAEALEQAAKLRVIVFLGDQPEIFIGPGVAQNLENRGIRMDTTPGTATNAVADMACALVMASLRRVPYLTEEVRAGRWPNFTGTELVGNTIGVYGMGKIGYALVKRLMCFEPQAVLYSDIVRSERSEEDFGARRVEPDRLFAESDVLSVHTGLTPETKGIVGEELLRRMKPTAVLVNAARAAIVDARALRKALSEGWLACAAFDGYYVEGPEFMELGPERDPYGLLQMRDRFFVTSHQGFNTVETLRRASETAAEKLVSFFSASGPEERAA